MSNVDAPLYGSSEGAHIIRWCVKSYPLISECTLSDVSGATLSALGT